MKNVQLAVDGETITLGYTQYARVVDGCGGVSFADTAVFVRSRTLPDGPWSKPRRIGRADDELVALRARDERLHAVVDRGTHLTYEMVDGDRVHEVRLGDVFGSTSLRIGNDGGARFLNATGGPVRYGSLDGDEISWSRVPRSDNAYAAQLVLGSDGGAHILWTQDLHAMGGCIDGPLVEDPGAGTYYATNAGGSWDVERVSRGVGPSSFTVDPATGRVHLVTSDGRLRYFVKDPGTPGVPHASR